jgi:site-specific DNA-methyltransferase (adenine-specific)
MATLPEQSVHCCVTSPPYFGLRDYGHDGQIGLEDTPDAYVRQLVEVFRAVRRVLRDDGTLWLNLGDSYASDKNLLGIPWRVAFALQADGWYLRQDIIWHKPNPMPESVTDRCTKAHEYVFLLSKGPRYWFDAEAIAEPATYAPGCGWDNAKQGDYSDTKRKAHDYREPQQPFRAIKDTRNKRSVWTIATRPFAEAHFATMAPELAETCIRAGCPTGGTVLDPFGGAGTTGLVADRLQRDAVLCELNPEYIQIAKRRIFGDAPLFAEVEAA